MKGPEHTNRATEMDQASTDEVVHCGEAGWRDSPDSVGQGGVPRNLAEEVGKKEPFDSPAQEAFLNIVRTQEALANEFEQFFKGHGLSSSQYNALRILRGHAPEPLACSAIAREMVTREPDITRLIDRLERSGLAKRQRCSEDRRVVRVRITDEALALLERIDDEVHALHRRQLAHMPDGQLAELSRLLFIARHPEQPLEAGG